VHSKKWRKSDSSIDACSNIFLNSGELYARIFFWGVFRQVIAVEERRQLESMEEDLKVIDAVADRAWGASCLLQFGCVVEDIFSGDVLDVDTRECDAL
jgi:hypothetical protein